MLAFLMHNRTAWDDYFTGTPTLIQKQEYGTRQTRSGTSVHVLNCLFMSISSTSSGGALYCSSITYLLVETTSFFSCKTSSGDGGAIYFSNSGGQSVLNEVCGYDCISTSGGSHGQFVYIIVNGATSSKNYVNYTSITRCVNENSGSYRMLDLRYGKVYCPSINSSMNKCYTRPGINCEPSSDSNSVTGSLTYSTFADNIANNYNCILLERSGAKYEIKSCNILRNSQVTLGSYGTILTNGILTIENSCILENRANYIFYQGSSYTITLSKCTVDSTSNNGYMTIQNTVTKSFVLALNHMSTRNCHAIYDVAGTLTPIMQPSSPSNKRNLYYTCKRLFLQPPQGNFVSLTSVLVLAFNFINPYSSVYSLY